MHPWHDLPPGTADHPLAYIEIGRGMRTKYELDKPSGILRLDRILYGALHYPINYGIVPQTLAEDNDPLDILVYSSEPLQPGTILYTRLIGVLHMVDDDEVDDKLIALPLEDAATEHIQTPDDLPKAFQNELAHFFETYKQLKGKKVTAPGLEPLSKAKQLFADSLKRYNKTYKRP